MCNLLFPTNRSIRLILCLTRALLVKALPNPNIDNDLQRVRVSAASNNVFWSRLSIFLHVFLIKLCNNFPACIDRSLCCLATIIRS